MADQNSLTKIRNFIAAGMQLSFIAGKPSLSPRALEIISDLKGRLREFDEADFNDFEDWFPKFKSFLDVMIRLKEHLPRAANPEEAKRFQEIVEKLRPLFVELRDTWEQRH